MNNYTVFDIETSDLEGSTIHCLSYKRVTIDEDEVKWENGDLTNYEDIKIFMENQSTLIGHNIRRFDLPVLEKKLGIKIQARIIDTLGLSWYLYPERPSHNLEGWGEDLGVAKPYISDWVNLSVDDYINRCSTDVVINSLLWDLQWKHLLEIYGSPEAAMRLIGYIDFKLDCAREQEEVKWRLDIELCKKNLAFIIEENKKKIEMLRIVMPKVPSYSIYSRPKIMYKKDETLSAHGEKWLARLRENNLPEHHVGSIRVITGYDDPNPGSHQQLKSWLYSLGWIPQTFDVKKEVDSDGQMTLRKVPQINTKDDGICESVKALYEKEPNLEYIEGLFVTRHRIGILEGFLECVDKDGLLKAEIQGLTNTLRFQHVKPIVNLPTIPKPYWEEIRGCLIAPDSEHILCGSDMSKLEDNTKLHYMWYYDPDYVKEMQEYGFDAHCDIAVQAKKMSKDDECFYKWYTAKKEGKDHNRILREYLAKNFGPELRQRNSATDYTLEQMLKLSDVDQAAVIKILKPIRLKNKKVNFSAVYGAGAPKIALTASIPLSEAKPLKDVYWRRNWSVKAIARDAIKKTVGNRKWLFNPVSHLWYSLREEKDAFSTLNQGTGVYAFDTWIRHVRKQGVRICGQFHDEHIAPVLKYQTEEHTEKLKLAIDQTNKELQLNVQLGISIDFGHSYKDIH